MPSSSSAWKLAAVGMLPPLAILIGGGVARLHGVPATAFTVNAAAVVLGLALLAGLGRLSWKGLVDQSSGIAIGGVLLLATTLVFPGIEGVSRWIMLGPLRLNASAVTMPWLLLAVGGLLSRSRPALALGCVAATQALHVLQPDAGQATAFGVSAALLLCTTRATGSGWRVTGCALALLGVAVAWLRPDPLPAVPHVEQILHLAADSGTLWLLAALLAVGALLAPAVHRAVALRSLKSEAAPLAASLALYLGLTFAVTELGNFPVPVLGAGAGPVLGWYFLLRVAWLPPRGVA